MEEKEKARKIKFKQDKAKWEKMQKESKFQDSLRKSQVERGLTNYEALLEWQRDPRNKTELGKKKDKLIESLMGGIKNIFVSQKNQTTYQGTVLDNLNPETTVSTLDSLLKMFGKETFNASPDKEYSFEPRFQDNERDALRHYIGTQAIADKFGPGLAGLITNLNEYPYDSTNVNKRVDIQNNSKALDDFNSGNMLNPNWLNMLQYADEQNSGNVLDSLLQTLTIPPTDSEY